MDAAVGYGREIVSLFVVFLLLGLTVWKLGRRRGRLPRTRLLAATFLSRKFAGNRRPAEPVLETLERLALTPQHTLHVLRLRNREIVLATHPQGCTVLDKFEGVPEGARGAGA
jgi:hypothetical protein